MSNHLLETFNICHSPYMYKYTSISKVVYVKKEFGAVVCFDNTLFCTQQILDIFIHVWNITTHMQYFSVFKYLDLVTLNHVP